MQNDFCDPARWLPMPRAPRRRSEPISSLIERPPRRATGTPVIFTQEVPSAPTSSTPCGRSANPRVAGLPYPGGMPGRSAPGSFAWKGRWGSRSWTSSRPRPAGNVRIGKSARYKLAFLGTDLQLPAQRPGHPDPADHGGLLETSACCGRSATPISSTYHVRVIEDWRCRARARAEHHCRVDDSWAALERFPARPVLSTEVLDVIGRKRVATVGNLRRDRRLQLRGRPRAGGPSRKALGRAPAEAASEQAGTLGRR